MSSFSFLLKHYVAEVWSRRWMVLGVAWLVGILGAASVMTVKDRYRSHASIQVDTAALLALSGIPQSAAIGTDKQVENIRELIRDRANIERIMYRTDLETDDAELLANLAVTRTRPDTYRLQYTAESPELARRVVQEALTGFVEQHLVREQTVDKNNAVQLKRDLDRLEEELQQAADALSSFKSGNSEYLTDAEGLQRQVREAETLVKNAGIEQALIEAQRDILTVRLATTSKQKVVGNFGGSTAASRKLTDLQTKRDNLLEIYTRDHPDIVAIERLIEQARTQLANATSNTGKTYQENPVYIQRAAQLAAINKQIFQLREQAGANNKMIAEFRNILNRQPFVRNELALLQEDYDRKAAEFQQVNAEFEQLVNDENIGRTTPVVSYQVIVPPVLAASPVGPDRIKLLVAALLCAVSAGLGLACIRAAMANNFPSLLHLYRAFDLPILGNISVADPVRRRGISVLGILVWIICALGLVGLFAALAYASLVLNWHLDPANILERVHTLFS